VAPNKPGVPVAVGTAAVAADLEKRPLLEEADAPPNKVVPAAGIVNPLLLLPPNTAAGVVLDDAGVLLKPDPAEAGAPNRLEPEESEAENKPPDEGPEPKSEVADWPKRPPPELGALAS
jgi:hypothetical protein